MMMLCRLIEQDYWNLDKYNILAQMKTMEEIAQDLDTTKLTEDLDTQYDKLIESLQAAKENKTMMNFDGLLYILGSIPMFIITLVIGLTLIFYAVHTYALLRSSSNSNGSIKTARWSVTRNQSQSGDSIEIMPGGATDSYTLTVQSDSEVDVIYSIIISNLPAGVEVDLDNSGNYRTQSTGTIRISPAGTINYNDSVKTKTHTLTFRATNVANPITNQEIDIDVEFKQGL